MGWFGVQMFCANCKKAQWRHVCRRRILLFKLYFRTLPISATVEPIYISLVYAGCHMWKPALTGPIFQMYFNDALVSIIDWHYL